MDVKGIAWLEALQDLLQTLHFDKLVHFFMYTILGLLTAWGVREAGLFSLLIGFSYGCLDEFHQTYIPGRNFDVFDIAADCAGVLFGLWVYRRRKKSKVLSE